MRILLLLFFLSMSGASFGDGAYAAPGARCNGKWSSCILKHVYALPCFWKWKLNPAGSQLIFLFGG